MIHNKLITKNLNIMGNNPSKNVNIGRNGQIKHIYTTSNKKANQIHLWYIEERFRDFPISSSQIVSYNISQSIQLLIQGRCIGTTGVSKILSEISPLKFINKINPSLALLSSMILTIVDTIGYFPMSGSGNQRNILLSFDNVETHT